MRSLAFFIALTSELLSACTADEDGLKALHANIAADHASVAQISPKDYLALDRADTILVDLREPDEYAVSRIPGAIWVNPDADAESTLIQIGDVRGKNIIVYCSVGKRSSIFAEREQEQLFKMGALSVSNLETGIFGWHNDERELVDANGKTDVVHPYDAFWKRYVGRKDKARYAPISEN